MVIKDRGIEGVAQQSMPFDEHRPDIEVKHPQVVVAIPCLNTAPFIANIVSKAKKYADEVIVVDDGSDDGTAEAARVAGATIVRHEKNQGYGGAIRSCFIAARQNNADILVIIDGDAQHDPSEIPLVAKPVIDGSADIVIGTRFHSNSKTNMPRYRKFGIDIITFLWNFRAKVKVTDSQSGFRAYRRIIFQDVSLNEKAMGMSIEILENARRMGAKFAEVPITCHYIQTTMTRQAVLHGYDVALAVIRIRLTNSLLQKRFK
jgi:glycosyltransferase involved in cell wall biosynthesis